MMDTYFPDPVEHAATLLDACKSVEAAQEAAQTNIEFSTTPKDFRYWSMVREALSAQCNRPSN